jgi:hypothetical protein
MTRKEDVICYLKSKERDEEILNIPFSMFGDNNALEFVEKLDSDDAWATVLGNFKRMLG